MRLKAGNIPCQIILCAKEKPKGDFDSVQWIVSAIGSALNPRVWIPISLRVPPPPTILHEQWKQEIARRYLPKNDSRSTAGSLSTQWVPPHGPPPRPPEVENGDAIEVTTTSYDGAGANERYLDKLQLLRKSAEPRRGVSRSTSRSRRMSTTLKSFRKSIMDFI